MSSYGSAEMSWIAWGYAEDVQEQERCVGRVVDAMEVAAFASDGHRLPPGTEGEIRVRGPDGYAGAYIGEDTPQDEIFKDGWFVTGDIGVVDSDGNLMIRGRLSNVINIGGSKVSPELMEEQILAFSQIRDVGVTGIDVPEGYQKACAAIVTKTKLSLDDVNAHLERRGALWPVQEIRIVDAIPRTESGKVDRTALRSLCNDR
jgi:acyl-coenzyme A synthetase/AMP-(fatty) acid ligase